MLGRVVGVHLDSRTFGGVPALDEGPRVEMHPDDAAEHDLLDGQRVSLANEFGRVVLELRTTMSVRPGTVFVAKGSWLRTSETGQTINALVPGHRADLGDGACYYDTQVDVAAA